MVPGKKAVLSLLHATRGRAAEARTARERWLQAAEYPERVEHVFAFDRDDHDSVAGLSGFRHVVVEERDKGCVAAWNLSARASQGQILIQLSDDWLPIRHWDTKIAARFRDPSQPGVLRISDGRRVDDLLCMAIFTRPYLDLLGGDFLGPQYFGVYSDDEFSFRAYQHGVVIDARDIVFEHCHPSFVARGVYDETHQRQNDGRRFVEGRKIFLARNPSVRGRWLHEGTEERQYLPPGHAYAINTVAPVVHRKSPIGRDLPLPDAMATPPRVARHAESALARLAGAVRKLGTCAGRMADCLRAELGGGGAFASTLWPAGTVSRSPYAPPRLMESIPVYVLSFNQPSYLRNMIRQLTGLGVKPPEIRVVDNASSFPLALDYLRELEAGGFEVIRLERNFGPHEIFAPEAGIDWPEVFALTDPDLQFHPDMPATFRQDLLEVAAACGVWKCGCALSLEDSKLFRDFDYHGNLSIAEWEGRFWSSPLSVPSLQSKLERWGASVYDAPVDTTFAVYVKSRARESFLDGVRVAGVFACRHLPWYRQEFFADSRPNREESDFYTSLVKRHATTELAGRKKKASTDANA
jgi:hypothetical protein